MLVNATSADARPVPASDAAEATSEAPSGRGGVVLAVAASLVTTFAGLIADPVQLWTGVHRRRLMRMLARLDRQQGPAGIEREHVLARLGDLGDIASSIWRGLR